MTKKRLDRDLKRFFQGSPKYQMRMDTDDFRGLVSLIDLVDGDYIFRDMPKAG